MRTNFDRFRLQIERPKPLTTPQQCALLEAAVARNPTAQLQRRLASMLMVADRYQEAIPIWEECISRAPDWAAYHRLAHARLALETEEDTRRARDAALSAVTFAPDAGQRAASLAALGKSLARLGDTDAAETALESALLANPHDKDACKRLVALLLRRNDPQAVLALYERLLGQGVGHARLFAARTAALARLGRFDDAHAFENIDRFSLRRVLPPPPGWESIASFNTALADELAHHPALRFERYGTASTRTWRIDEPAAGGSELLAALYAQMQEFVCDFIDEVAGDDHPWAHARPKQGVLHNWCVITDGPGFEEWHVHQFGWLSGVYYVAVPDAIARVTSEAGCIGFGLPEDLVGPEASRGYGIDLIRPQSGLAMLFPSHVYHRTFQHGVSERRICLAFDVWPA